METTENYLVYQHTTETIRQMPQNYLIAYKIDKHWVCEPDLASDRYLAMRVFLALFDFNIKYGSGFDIIEASAPKRDRPIGLGLHFLRNEELIREFTSMRKDEFLKVNPQISDMEYENTFNEGNYVFNSMRVPKLRKGALK